MADDNLPTVPPPPEAISRQEARSLEVRLDQAISTGAVREAASVDAYRDRLQLAATRPNAAPPPSQAQRDAARAATPAASSAPAPRPEATAVARPRL